MAEITDAAYERETVIVWTDGDPVVYVSSSRRPDITSLEKNPLFTMIEDHDALNGNPRMIKGTMPKGAITFRSRMKGQTGTVVKPTGKKRTLPSSAKRCLAPKADGKLCQSLASKATGRCARHPNA